MPTTLGEHIRKVRLKRKQTQGQIAKLLHVNQMNLSAWELNQKVPHPKYAEIIIDFLGYIPTITSKIERLGTRIKLYRLKHKLSINEFCKLKQIDKALVYKHEMQRFCKFSEKEYEVIEQVL